MTRVGDGVSAIHCYMLLLVFLYISMFLRVILLLTSSKFSEVMLLVPSNESSLLRALSVPSALGPGGTVLTVVPVFSYDNRLLVV